ncbi:iron dependent repressor, metal binding and dimerization domain protein [Vallitalea longa]
MEDYLEMIYRICKEENYVRMNQLANRLNVRPSSSTKLVQKLSSIDLVNYKKYGLISLTKKGEEIGKFLYHRHNVIEKFLRLIGVKHNLLKDTELMEHYIKPRVLKNIEHLNYFFEDNSEVLEKYYDSLESIKK